MAAVAALHGVSLAFGANTIVRDVDLVIGRGEFVSVVGPSGAGKSTLLRLLAGLIQPGAGTVTPATTSDPARRANGLVFQDARLLPWRRVIGNVELGLEGLAVRAADRRRRASVALAMVGLGEMEQRWPHQLSGGQRQRVGLARAFAVEPELLLMDEPFGALDAITRASLQDDLVALWQGSRRAVLFVTHDIDEAVLLADRVLVLGGRPARVVGSVVSPPRPRDRTDTALQEAGRLVRQILQGLV